MSASLTDLRPSLRALLKTPGFTAAAVATLALGMTLCTLTMAVLNAYLLNDLPYPAADRLVWIRYGAPGGDQPRDLERLDWASLDDVLEHPIAWDLDAFYLLGGTHAESAFGAWVTRGFVQGLGIQPAIGRGLDAAAFEPGGPNEVLISHRLWSSRFGSDPHVVGQTFMAYVSDRPQEAERFTIVGILPAGLWHLNVYTDVLAPLRVPTFPYMARLREGVTRDEAAARIAALVSSGARNVPPRWSPVLVAAHDAHVESVRPLLRTVSIAAALVLIVACGNVAGLLLVRATRREREIAIRTALGAGRGAIARMLLAEGLILGSAATVAALVFSRLAIASLAPVVQQQLGRSAPGGIPAFTIDASVMVFAAAAGVLTALMCALVPLASALRPGTLSTLQSGNRSMTEGVRSRRVRAALIAAEVALSLTLVAGSALMLRTTASLLRADLGFAADRVVLASVTLRQNRYPDAAARAAVFARMAARLRVMPGAESVGLTTAWPLQTPQRRPVETAGPSGRETTPAATHAVSEDYFATLGIGRAAGRGFTDADRLGTAPVAMVSESLARRLWPSSSAVGKRLTVLQDAERGDPVPVEREVVGVVRNVRQHPSDVDLDDVYVPMLQAPTRFTFVLVRTAGAPAGWVGPLREAFRDIDPEMAVDRARPLSDVLDGMTSRPKFLAGLLGSFAGAAALLALVGVYGVIAYAARQREREIAVRLAIGADPRRITGLFVRQGGTILAVGLALGVCGALGAGRLLESQLFGVTPGDPIALAAAVAAFGAAGLAAIWWPSRRAASTDPALALRAE